jgi:metal-responsive CopG/Arc/MetJ family transcriptional regulator
MKSSTVNISFNDELLKKIDRVAQQESRSRSELIREAARAYIERKNRWEQIFAYSEKRTRTKRLSQEDIAEEIADYRAEKRKSR